MVGPPLSLLLRLKREPIQTTVLKQTSPTLVDMVIVYHIAKKMVHYDIFSLKCENIFGYCPFQLHSQESETFLKFKIGVQ